jgi:hypothetical protein
LLFVDTGIRRFATGGGLFRAVMPLLSRGVDCVRAVESGILPGGFPPTERQQDPVLDKARRFLDLTKYDPPTNGL